MGHSVGRLEAITRDWTSIVAIGGSPSGFKRQDTEAGIERRTDRRRERCRERERRRKRRRERREERHREGRRKPRKRSRVEGITSSSEREKPSNNHSYTAQRGVIILGCLSLFRPLSAGPMTATRANRVVHRRFASDGKGPGCGDIAKGANALQHGACLRDARRSRGTQTPDGPQVSMPLRQKKLKAPALH